MEEVEKRFKGVLENKVGGMIRDVENAKAGYERSTSNVDDL